MGIYIILNIINGNFYVGSSKELKKREQVHFRELLNNKHHCKHLQNSFNIYGKDNFIFYVLEKIEDINLLRDREQFYIDLSNKDYLFNSSLVAGNNVNHFVSSSQRNKLKLKFSGTKRNQETIEKLRIASTGKYLSEIAKEKLRSFNKGRKRSDSMKLKMKEIMKSKCKSVIAINIETNEEILFESITTASLFTKVETSKISFIINQKVDKRGKRRFSSKGWKFRYP